MNTLKQEALQRFNDIIKPRRLCTNDLLKVWRGDQEPPVLLQINILGRIKALGDHL